MKKYSHFTQNLYNEILPDGIEYHYWNIARFKLINSILNYITIPIKALSIGCGRGVDVKLLSEYGIKIKGIEPADVAPLKDIQNDVITNTNPLSNNQKFNQKFNTIFLLEVLEHLNEPEKMLIDILNTYTNVKYIVVSVPARNEIFSNYDTKVGHIKRYDLNDIETLAGKTGMKVVYKTYIFHILYILTRLWLKLFKQRPTTVTAPKKNIRKLHYAIAFFVSLESIVLPRNWYGTSIISILATKK